MNAFKSFFKSEAGLLAGFACIGSILGALLRFEIMTDLVNYHYYNGFAFATGRTADIAPAAYHSFFNPLLDAVCRFLIDRLNERPVLYYAVAGIPFGVLMYVCLKINRLFFDRPSSLAFSLAVAATGFAAWFQIGTSGHEIFIAVLVLTAVYFLLQDKHTLWATFLLGAAAGFKLTAATYCLSSAAVFIAFHPKDFKRIFLFALCGLIGFLSVNGFWMYRLYVLYGNPFFPFLNGLFLSDYFAPVNFSLQQHEAPNLDTSLFSLLTLPFSLIAVKAGDNATMDVLNFTDFRWLVALLIAVGYLFVRKRTALSKQEKMLAVWLIVSYVIWNRLFLVLRYLVPVEVLLPVFFVKAGLYIQNKTYAGLFRGGVFLLCLSTPFLSESWGRQYGETVLPPMPALNIPDGTVFLTTGDRNSAYPARIGEKRKIRIVHRNEPLWPYIAHTKWGEEIKKAARENTPKMLWISGPIPALQIDGMTCLHFIDDQDHWICVPSNIAADVFQIKTSASPSVPNA